MKLTYNGHACFTLEHAGFRAVLDPFDGHVPGYPVPVQQAEAVYCSHGHGDHAYLEAVTRTGVGENPFAVTEVMTCHDDCGGEKRGKNTGWLAGKLMGTKFSLLMNIIIGILGGFLGGLILGLVGFGATNIIGGLITGVAGSCLLIYLAKKYLK